MKKKMTEGRSGALFALTQSLKKKSYVADALQQWADSEIPTQEKRLAWEIAQGTMRRMRTLEYIALCATSKQKLRLKPAARALLYMTIYQIYFMRIPSHAAVNETMELAKRMLPRPIIPFFNAVLRKVCSATIEIPNKPLGLFLSYPDPLIQHFCNQFGEEKATELLSIMNEPGKVVGRIVGKANPFAFTEEISEKTYIQNYTPATLLERCCSTIATPHCILDLCAAPGGKTLAIHDLFPQAKLFANDCREEKLARLKENFERFSIDATLSCCQGEDFPDNQLFDLIILDVPCSNSGVLHKRVEARWRTDHTELLHLQRKLLKKASSLLRPESHICYMTCSILTGENEEQVTWATQNLPLKKVKEECIFPNREGWDGGYAALLKYEGKE